MNGCQKARLQMSRKLDGVLPPAEGPVKIVFLWD